MNQNLLQHVSFKTKVTATVLGIFLIGIWSLAFYSSKMLRIDLEKLLFEQQFSAATFAASEVNQEITNRFAALELTAQAITEPMRRDSALLQHFLEQRVVLRSLFNGGVFVARQDGIVIADMPKDTGRLGVNLMERDSIATAITAGKSSVGKPVVGKKLVAPIFHITVPLKNHEGKIVGALSGVTNLGQPNFLDKIPENRFGQTGGYLLIAKQHRLIVTATEKHRAMEALPSSGLSAAIERFIQGYEGSEILINPHGMEVLVSAKGVPAANWYVAVMLPTKEAFAPTRAMQERILASALLLTLLAGASIWWILWHQLSPVQAAAKKLIAMSESDASPTPLPVTRQDEIGGLIGSFNQLIEKLHQREQALRDAERKFRALFDMSPIGVAYHEMIYDEAGKPLDYRYLDANQGFIDLTGVDPRGKTVREAFSGIENDPFNWIGTFADVVNTGQTLRFEQRLQQSGRWYECVAFQYKANQFVVVFMETTQRKLTELALRESESRFRSLMENTHNIAVQGYAPDGTITFWNPASERLYGYTEAETIGRNLIDLIIPDDMQHEVRQAIASMHKTGIPIPAGELSLKRKDGSRVPVFSSHAILNPGNRPAEMFCLDIDLTERKQFETKLQQSESHFRFVAESAQALIWLAGRDKLCTWFNKVWLDFTGKTLEQEKGNGWVDGVYPGDLARCWEIYSSHFDARLPFSMEYRLRRHDGEYRWIIDNGSPYFGSDGSFEGYIGSCFDITDRKLAEEKLRLSASVFTHAREGIVITEADGRIIEVNEAFTRITGYTPEEVQGRKMQLLQSGQHDKKFYAAMWRDMQKKGQWYGELWNRRKNGDLFATMQTISAVRDEQGNIKNFVSLFADITALKEHERQLEHIAHFDALTTLPNRVLLADRLQQAMTHARRRKRRLAVAYLDMDGFKNVNDLHGHEIGDQLLVALAARMKQALREGDTLARLGGDEFVAVLPDLTDIESSVPFLTRLLEAASQPERISDHQLQISASVGITFYPQAEEVDADQLLRQADQAMYQAKLAGKNRYHIFDAEQDRNVRGRHESLERIRNALADGEFLLHYQPKVNMRTGDVIGVEALIRWQHPEKGLLSPGAFLPIVESHPLSVDIGNWVIRTALADKTSWCRMGLKAPVSVNLSARHLQQPDFIEQLGMMLKRHPELSPGDLEFEVLETGALEDLIRVSRVIESCRELGINFALDDFGTGYSSLTYLKRLPVTQIKIDQSFVRDILDDPEDVAILRAMLGLSTVFQREIIAEGAETGRHCAMLLHLGCDLAQGFGIAHPMPAEQLPDWVASWRPDPNWFVNTQTTS